MDILPQLLQMVRHDLSTDPLQNELTTLRKLQKALSERHNEEVFPFLASLISPYRLLQQHLYYFVNLQDYSIPHSFEN